MTDTTKIYMIEELCKLLGKENLTNFHMSEDGKLWAHSTKGEGHQCVLSPSGTIPSDECECGHKKEWHQSCKSETNNYHFCHECRMEYEQNYIKHQENKCCSCKVAIGFKPLLLTVKSIRLVETCRCGHVEVQHRNIAGGKMGCHAETESYETGTKEDEFCPCKSYEPVQKVEVDFE